MVTPQRRPRERPLGPLATDCSRKSTLGAARCATSPLQRRSFTGDVRIRASLIHNLHQNLRAYPCWRGSRYFAATPGATSAAKQHGCFVMSNFVDSGAIDKAAQSACPLGLPADPVRKLLGIRREQREPLP
jgi:hypothetical protein